MGGASMTPFHSPAARVAVCVLCLGLTSAGVASAQPSPPAALFDEGVRKFKQAQYAEAASAFLRADEAAPNAQALLNAIAAGRRAHAHLLVARAAERALARANAGADLLRLAREALVEAAAQLARIELSCAPAEAKVEKLASSGAGAAGASAGAVKRGGEGCAMVMDDAKVAAGGQYVLPGTHRFAAELAGAKRDEQALTCNAGATYTVVLRPVLEPAVVVTPPATATPKDTKGWPPTVVYVGAGATAVLVGLTVWSGVDALDAKNALPAVPARAQNDDVRGRARRTDGLVAGAVLAGVATAAAAVWLVAWDRPDGAKARIGVAPTSAGAQAVLQGRF